MFEEDGDGEMVRGEEVKVFVLLFLCSKDLEHGSGDEGGEDCG